jgi:hypothetical protein
MEMAEVTSTEMTRKIPKNVSNRFFAGSLGLIDVVYNDNEDVKHSVFCAFEASRHDVTFYFGFVRAGSTKGQKWFNDPDPKFVFRVLLVKVGSYHEVGKMYIGTDFEDKEFEPIWSKLDPLETSDVSASNWRNQNKLGPLVRKLQPREDNVYDIRKIAHLSRGSRV